MWIGENEIQAEIVKVKSLSKHEEFVIERAKLIENVLELIKENPILIP